MAGAEELLSPHRVGVSWILLFPKCQLKMRRGDADERRLKMHEKDEDDPL